MRRKKIVAVLSVIAISIVALLGIRFINTGVEPVVPSSLIEPRPEPSGAKLSTELTPLVIGSPDAKVTIVEYGDFKCPECGKFHQAAHQQIREEYVDTGKVKIIFRPYPIYSEDGALALAGSYCAQLQGKFTEYYDHMFDYMWTNHFRDGDYQKAIDPVLNEQVMASILGEIGVDVDQYNACLKDEDTTTAYFDDLYRAAPDEIQGTPSFIIGGQKIVGVQPFSVFKTLIDIELR